MDLIICCLRIVDRCSLFVVSCLEFGVPGLRVSSWVSGDAGMLSGCKLEFSVSGFGHRARGWNFGWQHR